MVFMGLSALKDELRIDGHFVWRTKRGVTRAASVLGRVFVVGEVVAPFGVASGKREMDHQPVSGPQGTLARLAGLSRPTKVYTHINNTNPMLLNGSPEREQVEAAGILVGHDGMSFSI